MQTDSGEAFGAAATVDLLSVIAISKKAMRQARTARFGFTRQDFARRNIRNTSCRSTQSIPGP